MYARAKGRAKSEGRAFDIELQDVVVPDRCPILGIPLAISPGKISAGSPSLDRVVNERGYVKGNVRVISHKANAAKSNLTRADVARLLAYMEGRL